MRIVATHAPVVGLFAVPIACPPAVYAVSPVPVLGAVAFAAEKIRVLEINWLAVAQRQEIVAIVRAVAVQAPDSHAAVVELYILVDQQIFPPLGSLRENPSPDRDTHGTE